MARAGRFIYDGLLFAWDGAWVIWYSEVVWVILCLPLVTIPLAFLGLYTCVNAMVYGESITWKTYFSSFKNKWAASYRWGLSNLVVLLVLGFYVWYFSPTRGNFTSNTLSSMLNGAALAMIILWLAVNQFTFPFMLEQEKLSYMHALRNSMVFLIKWPGFALGLILFNFLIYGLSIWLRFPWLFLGGSLPALLACLGVKSVVDQVRGLSSSANAR